MKWVMVIALFLVLLGHALAVNSCSECPSENSCCDDSLLGPTCYDPVLFRCIENNTLCGCENPTCSEGACNGNCYNADLYTCCNNLLVSLNDPEAASCNTQPAANTTQCASTICPSGNQCCNDEVIGPTCYDPSLYLCVNNVRLCGCESPECLEGVCNDACYDGRYYTCCNNELVTLDSPEAQNCAPATSACATTQCPTENQCCNDEVLGAVCYDPTLYVCVDNVRLCGCESPECLEGVCNDACYDGRFYTCCNNELVTLDSPEAQNCAPATSTCGSTQCPNGNQCCSDEVLGAVCYDPTLYVCVDNIRLCGCESPECLEGVCNDACYDGRFYTCCNNELVTLDSPEAQNCVPATTTCGSSQCPNGNQCCNDEVLGAVCYDPTLYVCVDNVRLCGCESPECLEGVCNDSCYDGRFYTCCDNELVTLDSPEAQNCGQTTNTCGTTQCPSGNECCNDEVIGPACYDPSTYLCVNNVRLCGCESPECLEGVCNDACYDGRFYTCCNNELLSLDDPQAQQCS